MELLNSNEITNLFPIALGELCTAKIWENLVGRGRYIERLSKQIMTRRRSSMKSYMRQPSQDDSEFDFVTSKYFINSVQETRSAMVGYLASHLLDRLQDVARREGSVTKDGHLFGFSVLCNERLTYLSVQDLDWRRFLDSSPGSRLFASCLSQLSGLMSLTVNVANNDMLYEIANTCQKLCKLDISNSSDVTDLGLVYLSGLTVPTYSLQIHQRAPIGCRYLRELIFNSDVMPRVTSYLLKHLSFLSILKFSNLHEGIQQYSRSRRITPLMLTHFFGPDDKLPRSLI